MYEEINIRQGSARNLEKSDSFPVLQNYVSDDVWNLAVKRIISDIKSESIQDNTIETLSLLYSVDSKNFESDLGEHVRANMNIIYNGFKSGLKDISFEFAGQTLFVHAAFLTRLRNDQFLKKYGIPTEYQETKELQDFWDAIKMYVIAAKSHKNPGVLYRRAAECMVFGNKEWVLGFLPQERDSELIEWQKTKRVENVISFLITAAAIIQLDDPRLNNLIVPPVTQAEFKQGVSFSLRSEYSQTIMKFSLAQALKTISERAAKEVASSALKRQPLPLMRN